MQKKILVLFNLAAINCGFSGEWDYNAGFGYRSEPLGVAANATAGFGQSLWDLRQSGKQSRGLDSVMYGYVRPQARVQTSGVVNSIDTRLEIFPISIFGVSLGHNSSFRQIDFDGVACEQVSCRGQVNRSYFQMQMAGGMTQWVVIGLLRYEAIEGSGNIGQSIYDEASSLMAGPSGDNLSNYDLAALYKPTDKIHLGLFHSKYFFKGSGQKSELNSLIYSQKLGVYQYQAGVGFYNSSLNPRNSPTFFVSMKWVPKASIGIL